LRVRQVSSRATRDLDLRSSAGTVALAVDALVAAMDSDLGGGMKFQVSREPAPLGPDHTGGSIGVNIRVEALLGGEFIASVSNDLVTGRDPSGPVARLPRPMAIALPGIVEAHIDTYPVEDHIADKVWATMTLYGDRPSSFSVPPDWQAGWRALMTTYPDRDFPTEFGDALGLVWMLLEPVLAGEVTRGRWDPAAASWALAER